MYVVKQINKISISRKFCLKIIISTHTKKTIARIVSKIKICSTSLHVNFDICQNLFQQNITSSFFTMILDNVQRYQQQKQTSEAKY